LSAADALIRRRGAPRGVTAIWAVMAPGRGIVTRVQFSVTVHSAPQAA
jgi:hypothetical protein